jgi:hypothetical protein
MSVAVERESVVGQTEKNSVRAYVFRVTPESGHCPMQSAYLKGAMKRTHAPQQTGRYSITSSAVPSNVGGTMRSSALAAFMLMISSSFVDC